MLFQRCTSDVKLFPETKHFSSHLHSFAFDYVRKLFLDNWTFCRWSDKCLILFIPFLCIVYIRSDCHKHTRSLMIETYKVNLMTAKKTKQMENKKGTNLPTMWKHLFNSHWKFVVCQFQFMQFVRTNNEKVPSVYSKPCEIIHMTKLHDEFDAKVETQLHNSSRHFMWNPKTMYNTLCKWRTPFFFFFFNAKWKLANNRQKKNA